MTFDEVDLYSCLAALHWWAYDEPGRDHDFYKAVIEQAGWLALDVGCGAGRLLRSYLRAGLAVEGVDMAADMLAMCREKARAEGLQTVLYKQPLQALDLPQRYAAIIVPCGSFVCVMGRDHALEALRRFYAHLLPGGILAFNVYLPDYDYSQPATPTATPTNGSRTWRRPTRSTPAGGWSSSDGRSAPITWNRSSARSGATGSTRTTSSWRRRCMPARINCLSLCAVRSLWLKQCQSGSCCPAKQQIVGCMV